MALSRPLRPRRSRAARPLDGATFSEDELRASPLVGRLCSALEAAEIRYCHWKSTTALERSAAGDTDLDLLVDRSSIESFREVLAALGFKIAELPARSRAPGMCDFYGYDAEGGRFLHVHAHWQLVLGHDASKGYRLPLERPFLDSATRRGPFRVPAPELELLVFVLRMMLKHATWAAVVSGQGRLSATEARELQDLEARTDPQRLVEALRTHASSIPEALFERCRQSLGRNLSPWRRIAIARLLQTRLAPHARRSTWREAFLVLSWRPVRLARRLLGRPVRRRLASGGALVALVGGDGAGKTTAVDCLTSWLAPVFFVRRVHLGKPAWSWTTRSVRGGLKVLRSLGIGSYERPSERYLQDPASEWIPSYSLMLREVCTARDRYRTYRQACRWAANGCIVLADRYPVPELRQMDTAFVAQAVGDDRHNRFTRWLASVEEKYYRAILPPDQLFVLQLDPEIALQRRADEDSHPSALRARASEVWKTDWGSSSAHLIDAAKPQAEVLAEMKTLLWTVL